MSTVSIAILTWNRANVTCKALGVSLKNTGLNWDELIWADNGSTAGQYALMDYFMNGFPNVHRIQFAENTGMSRGINTILSMARTDYVVLVGADVFQPDYWLKIYVQYMDTIPDAGIVAMWNVPGHYVTERYRGSREPENINGLPVLKALPFDQYIIRRKILQTTGYLREDFGLYGWSDVEWLYRCERIMPTIGYQGYVIPNMHGHHLDNEGADEFRLGVDEDYIKWKQGQVALKSNHELMGKCAKEGYQYYSPF